MALRRKKAEVSEVEVVEQVPAEQPVPFWKKEISLKRKAKVETADVAEREVEEAPLAEAEKPVPFWKKEISLKRRAKAEKAGAAEVEPVESFESVEDEPAEKPVPFWKKEISLKRGAKAEKAEEAELEVEQAPVAEPEVPAGKPVPFWKKEISLGRKPKPEAEQAEPEADEDGWNRELIFGSAEPAVQPDPEPEPEPLPEPVFFELPPEAEPVDEPEAEVGPPAIDERPWASTDISPSVSSAYGWLTDDLEPADLASTSWAGTSPPIPVVHASAGDTSAGEAASEAAPEPEPEVVTEPVLEAEPDLEPEPVLETIGPPPAPPVEIHPPVTAAELPLLPEDEEQPSRLSFRRKRKEEAAAEPELEARNEPEEHEDGAPKTSLLKREISFGRKPKADRPERKPKRRRKERDAEPAPADEQAAEPKERRRVKSGGGRNRKLVGLKIGASQLAAARVHNNGSAQLVQLARADLDPGVVVGGELRDVDALATALKEFFKRHKLPKSGVRLGIANNRIGVRSFDLAGIDDPKQLANAIRFRAQEALPIPIEEAVLDYRVLGENVDEEGATSRRVLLVVAYRDLVDRYVEACRRAGIKLAGIDLEAFALLRALSSPPEDEEYVPEAATVAVAVGHERSTFAVSDGRVCEFTRVLEWGGASLNVAIARALDLAPSEAEPIKRALSLAAETEIEGLDADQVAQAREALMRQVQAFARELVSSLQFYQGQPGSLGIAEITITGGTAHLPGLAAELERLIGVRVRVADPLARVRVGKKVGDEEQIGSLAVAIGLGIDD